MAGLAHDLMVAASLPRPLEHIDLGSVLERLGSTLPIELVSEAARRELARFAPTVPRDLHWIMFETRLAGGDPERVDLLAAMIGDDVPHAHVEGAPLVAAWTGRRAAALRDAHVLWLEWDWPYRRPPLQIASIDSRFWGAARAPDTRPAASAQAALAAAVYAASFGAAHDPRIGLGLERAIACLPPSGAALFSASLAPRGVVMTDRLFVELAPAEVGAWLEAIGWPGDHEVAAHWLERVVARWEPAYLQIEVTPEGLTPYLAIESRQTSPAGGRRSERRERQRFLDGLVADGLATADRVAALLRWDGVEVVGRSRWFRTHHLKCVVGARGTGEVKAYLGVHGRP